MKTPNSKLKLKNILLVEGIKEPKTKDNEQLQELFGLFGSDSPEEAMVKKLTAYATKLEQLGSRFKSELTTMAVDLDNEQAEFAYKTEMQFDKIIDMISRLKSKIMEPASARTAFPGATVKVGKKEKEIPPYDLGKAEKEREPGFPISRAY